MSEKHTVVLPFTDSIRAAVTQRIERAAGGRERYRPRAIDEGNYAAHTLWFFICSVTTFCLTMVVAELPCHCRDPHIVQPVPLPGVSSLCLRHHAMQIHAPCR